MPKTRVLLIGWDAADWKVIQPLLNAGQMPNLARLMAGGVHGNLATIYPVLSPMLWTSIATGKRPYKHGIHGFSEPLPDGSGVRPITLLSRKTKALWNILNQTGHRSVVVGWWPSHPAEPLNGAMVSNYFTLPLAQPAPLPPLPPGTVYPAQLAPALGELRVSPMELTGEFIRLFVPEYDRVDQAKDKRLHMLGKIIAETMSVHAAATELLGSARWDFAAIYYSGLDHFQHAFMRYHPPRLPDVSEEDFALYHEVVTNGYRYHDAMLGTLLGLADEHTTVVLISDHGFHPDHLRPDYIPAEPAGPAIEHRHFGIICLRGPGLRVNQALFGASLLDVCPTILTLFGLPPGRDMDGKVLLNAFEQAPALAPIESWDNVPGEAGTHPPETALDPVASAQAFNQLVELGYVAPPGPSVQETVRECVRELKYDLARAYRDGDCCGEAAALAEELWANWPSEHRFGILLVDCLGPLRQVARRRTAIEELGRRMEKYRAEAAAELARRAEQKAKEPKAEERLVGSPPTRANYEERRLHELAAGRSQLLEWLLLTQALMEKRTEEARRYLQTLTEAAAADGRAPRQLAGPLAQLGDREGARRLLESALEFDPENPLVHTQLAGLHLQAGRFDEAIAAATESLSLLYFQPGTHALLGQALMERQRFAEAEKALLVAVAQSPRNLTAHELLGRLYRQHLDRPAEAFAHEGRALTLRRELAAQVQAGATVNIATPIEPPLAQDAPRTTRHALVAPQRSEGGPRVTAPASPLPAPFAPDIPPEHIITIVSGLPRSGTSLMMQMLLAAGRQALTDGKRVADADNPLGYFEFENALTLGKDAAWLPQARGKVVKIVAQLLPHLPGSEHYQIILMERNLDEVIASQQAMLSRQGRRGAELDAKQLRETYVTQLRNVRHQLARRAEVRILSLNYADLLADPAGSARILVRFLGVPFDVEAAAKAVRPELRRHRA